MGHHHKSCLFLRQIMFSYHKSYVFWQQIMSSSNRSCVSWKHENPRSFFTVKEKGRIKIHTQIPLLKIWSTSLRIFCLKQNPKSNFMRRHFIREKIPMEFLGRKSVLTEFGRIWLLRWFWYMRFAWNFDPDLMGMVPGPKNGKQNDLIEIFWKTFYRPPPESFLTSFRH